MFQRILSLFDFTTNPIWREVTDFICDPETQWMGFCCLGIYFTAFLVLRFRASPGFLKLANPSIWLALGLFLGACRYAVNYSPSTPALVLLGGAVIGESIAVWIVFPSRFSHPSSKPVLLFWLVCALSLAAVWKTDTNHFYQYHGHVRWAGPWENPNIFGLLMATGLSLALGLSGDIWCLESRTRIAGNNSTQPVWKITVIVLCLGGAGLMARGLLYSYSRGAWLGAACGLGYLLWSNVQRLKAKPQTGWIRCFIQNQRPLSVILIAMFVLSFWYCRQTDWHPAQRVLSAFDTADFSTRNRLAAWKGALQILAENPWFGTGWGEPESLYEHYYMAPKLDESAAIEMNDYLLFGAMLGIPALFCFGIYLWLLLTGKSETGFQNKEERNQSADTLGEHCSGANRMQTTCKAGAIVLLVGFWFDGGLFIMPTAITFWILLELSAVEAPQNFRKWQMRSNCSQSLTFGVVIFFVLLFLGALFWAKEQDPFSKKWFTIKTPDHDSIKCVAVLPKPLRQYPVVIYAHGSGGRIINDGSELRRMAEFGLAAVSLEYVQTNDSTFTAQIDALLHYLGRQKWANTNAIAWAGFSLGANRMLGLTLQHPEQQPQLLILLSGAGESEGLIDERLKSLHCPVLLIHGEQDEIFSVADTIRLASILQTNGIRAVLKIVPDSLHNLEPERGMVFHNVGKYCFLNFAGDWSNYRSIAEWQAEAPSLSLFLLPGIAWVVAWSIVSRSRNRAPHRKQILNRYEVAIRWLAALLAIGAMAGTAIYFGVPEFPSNDKTISIARRFLIHPNERSDFEFMAARPIWRNKKLKTLLEHVELSSYNRKLVGWQLSDKMYRDDVLSAEIVGNSTEQLEWRRFLWEEFYPRVRHEPLPGGAARIVLRHLRERLVIITLPIPSQSVREIWTKQVTDDAGFELMCVAALRAVGVPAHLDSANHAEFWNGDKWQGDLRGTGWWQ